MASVYTNSDINILANLTLASMKEAIEMANIFSTGFRADVRLNDSAKVFVNAKTDDAADWDIASNNYGTVDDDTTTGVDITLSNKIKKTASVPEDVYAIMDIQEKLKDLGHSVAKEALKRCYDLIISATFGAPALTSIAANFTYDDVVDLEVIADDAGFGPMRSLVLANTYTANLKKDGILVANKNNPTDPRAVWQRFDAISNFATYSSVVLKSSTPATSQNLVGFITDKSAIALAMGTPAYTGGSEAEVVNVTDESGIGLQLRRHYDKATGNWLLNAVMLFGVGVTRAGALKRIVSA